MTGNASKTKAIILKKSKFSESDLIIQALTPSGEKLSLLGRGALRSKKRFGGGVLEPSHYVELHYSESVKSQGLSTLKEAILLDGFEGLRSDYDKIELALYIVECITKISQEGDFGSEGLFNLTGHALKALESAKNLDLFRLVFNLKILFQQGVLETEPWMGILLKTPLNKYQEIESDYVDFSMAKLNWSDDAIKRYLKDGGLN